MITTSLGKHLGLTYAEILMRGHSTAWPIVMDEGFHSLFHGKSFPNCVARMKGWLGMNNECIDDTPPEERTDLGTTSMYMYVHVCNEIGLNLILDVPGFIAACLTCGMRDAVRMYGGTSVAWDAYTHILPASYIHTHIDWAREQTKDAKLTSFISDLGGEKANPLLLERKTFFPYCFFGYRDESLIVSNFVEILPSIPHSFIQLTIYIPIFDLLVW